MNEENKMTVIDAAIAYVNFPVSSQADFYNANIALREIGVDMPNANEACAQMLADEVVRLRDREAGLMKISGDDSRTMRDLCQARDNYRRERDEAVALGSELREALRAAGEDKARVDWLVERRCRVEYVNIEELPGCFRAEYQVHQFNPNGTIYSSVCRHYDIVGIGLDARAAIDAARKAAK